MEILAKQVVKSLKSSGVIIQGEETKEACPS
jgi:hypothetical protein